MATRLGSPVPSPAPIQGVLPWAGGNAAGAFTAAATGDIGGIGASYQQAYNNALAMNSSNYNNILAGYQQALAGQSTAQSAIGAGYTDLYNNVLSKIENIGVAQANRINNDSARFLGRQSQQLIDRGLGNTTIQSSIERGVESDRNARQLELSEQTAGMVGNYMSQLGLADLGNRQRGLENQTSSQGRQLDWMNSVESAYPDAGMYASLAQIAAENQAQDDFGGGAFAGSNPMRGGGPGPKVGYVPDRYSGPETGGMAANIGASGGLGGGMTGGLGGNWDDGIGYIPANYNYSQSPAQDFGPFKGAYDDQPESAFETAGKGYSGYDSAAAAYDPFASDYF